MLTLVERRIDIEAGQSRLEARLAEGLTSLGEMSISFRPTTVQLPMYTAGAGDLWWARQNPHADQNTPRFWNAFGLYSPGKTQKIAVEINIALQPQSQSVAGFFATEPSTGKILLMHSGKLGGGLSGLTRAGFVQWLQWEAVDVLCRDRSTRQGIVIGGLDDEDLLTRLRLFVREASAFRESLAD